MAAGLLLLKWVKKNYDTAFKVTWIWGNTQWRLALSWIGVGSTNLCLSAELGMCPWSTLLHGSQDAEADLSWLRATLKFECGPLQHALHCWPLARQIMLLFLDLQVIFDDKKYLRLTELRLSCIKIHLADSEGRLTRKCKGNREYFESLFAKLV